MPSENRTRLEIFIPLGSNPAAQETVIEWLAEEMTFARGGATLTTPFMGFYLSATGRELVRDAVRVLFCDFDLNGDDPNHISELETYAGELRSMLMSVFHQEEIWITYYPVTRAS